MQNLDTYNSIDTLDIERQIEFLATFRAQGIITVENLFDEGEVQAFDDLWNGIAQRQAPEDSRVHRNTIGRRG